MNAEMQKAVPGNKKDTRFVYFGRMEKLGINSKKEEYIQWVHQGVVCVGYQVLGDGNLKIGVSFCSPEDAFSKKKAHLIIRQRMAAGKFDIVPNTGDGDFATMKYEELVGEIENFISSVVAVELPENGTDNDLPVLAGVRTPRWLT